uniref:Ig-like domain-containing protein n=1 Tax=Neogobius melanostomus TaxID=47308 RepID=A0A8C6SWK0_9GOBI
LMRCGCLMPLQLFFFTGEAWETEVIQSNIFKTVGLGDTVDVECHIDSKLRMRVWYKLTASRSLQLLASTDHFLKHNTMMRNDEKRFLITSSTTAYNLTISDTRWEDAGTYYCGVISLENVKFGGGTVLEIEGESKPVQSVLQRPDYIEAKPGDSVTLSCSFISRDCPQEHTSVTWVKSGSASRTVSWNHGNTTVACEMGDNPGETSCVHNLTLEDISSADDGIYICVVIVCGDTRFGCGSRIELNASVLVLVGVICKMYKKPTTGISDVSTAEDGVTYARVNVGPRSAPCRVNFEQNSQSTVVYSEVRNRQME